MINAFSHTTVPKTEMVGERIRYVKDGSNVILRCIVREALEPPIYISWFYNGHQLYNENVHGWKMSFERNILTGSDSSTRDLSLGGGLVAPSPPPSSSLPADAAVTSTSFYHRPSGSSVRFKSVCPPDDSIKF